MRKLIAAFKISLDGKTEGADGMADWVEAWSEDYGLTPQIDACIVGGGMLPGYERYWAGIRQEPDKVAWITGDPPTAGELEWSRLAAKVPHYVLSTTQIATDWPNVSFLRNVDDVAELKLRPGKDIYLMGGARVATSLMQKGLVDGLRLIIHPLIADEGSALFRAEVSRHELELLDVKALSKGRVRLDYTFRQHGR